MADCTGILLLRWEVLDEFPFRMEQSPIRIILGVDTKYNQHDTIPSKISPARMDEWTRTERTNNPHGVEEVATKIPFLNGFLSIHIAHTEPNNAPGCLARGNRSFIGSEL